MRRNVNVLKIRLNNVRDVFQYWEEAVEKGCCCKASLSRYCHFIIVKLGADVTRPIVFLNLV